MKRVKFTVAYDGTKYCGYQVQPELPTVEGVLNEALSALTGEVITVIGASRTDSGVHALGNVAVFDTGSTIPGDRFSYALNTKLPEDIRIVSSREVPAEFHPRHDVVEKTYEYRIDNREIADPLKRLYAMHFPRPVDISKMQEAAVSFVGEHDFTSFANPSSQVLKEGGSAVREIFEVSVLGRERSDIVIRVRGTGFLYNMVRIIAGTLLEVGTGRFQPEDIAGILEKKDRTKAGLTAEAKGLCLMEIVYKDNL